MGEDVLHRREGGNGFQDKTRQYLLSNTLKEIKIQHSEYLQVLASTCKYLQVLAKCLNSEEQVMFVELIKYNIDQFTNSY